MKNKQQYKLTGSFKKYKQVFDMVELIPDNPQNFTNPDKIFIRFDEREVPEARWYLEICEKTMSDDTGMADYEAITGEGSTLKDAEKDLENNYDRFLNNIVDSPVTSFSFPNLKYLNVTIGTSNSIYKESKEFYSASYANLQEIMLGENNIPWLLTDHRTTYDKVSKEEYDKLETIEYQYVPVIDGGGDYLRLTTVQTNIILFHVNGCIYNMFIDSIDNCVKIHPFILNTSNILILSDVRKIDKEEICDIWNTEQSQYVGCSFKKHEYMEALGFLKELTLV